MTLCQAVLAGHASAYGRLADLMRGKGATYFETHAVCKWHREAGKPEPTLATFDEMMQEADEEDSR